MYNKKIIENHVFVLHALVVSCIVFGLSTFSFDKQKWTVTVARYLFYIFFIRGSHEAVALAYKMINLKEKVNPQMLLQVYKTHLYIFAGAAAILFFYNESFFGEEFLMLFAAYLVVKYLEMSLEDVNKDVAGVKNRSYRNSAYKIHRPGPRAPVYLAAECATPLHTLHRVLQRRALYHELKNIDIEEVVRDFCNMLRSIIDKSEECRGKCELVYFDNTNPELNLADVLLDKIRELEPNFDNLKIN